MAEPTLFCNPVEKTHAGDITAVINPESHLTCYETEHREAFGGHVVVTNQFVDEKDVHFLCAVRKDVG